MASRSSSLKPESPVLRAKRNPKLAEPGKYQDAELRNSIKRYHESVKVIRGEQQGLIMYAYQCKLCPRQFKRGDFMSTHLQKVHDLDVYVKRQPSIAEKIRAEPGIVDTECATKRPASRQSNAGEVEGASPEIKVRRVALSNAHAAGDSQTTPAQKVSATACSQALVRPSESATSRLSLDSLGSVSGRRAAGILLDFPSVLGAITGALSTDVSNGSWYGYNTGKLLNSNVIPTSNDPLLSAAPAASVAPNVVDVRTRHVPSPSTITHRRDAMARALGIFRRVDEFLENRNPPWNTEELLREFMGTVADYEAWEVRMVIEHHIRIHLKSCHAIQQLMLGASSYLSLSQSSSY